jgi:nucleoside-diphosphate-sugar epimerase
LILESETQTFLDQCDQVVVYGANGWVGRSTVDLVSSLNPKGAKGKLLLIGSQPSTLNINQTDFEIHDSSTGIEQIKENAIFINSAFLRREFIRGLGNQEYIKRNLAITSFASLVIQSKKLLSFVNLSSGAARDMEQEVLPKSADAYSALKKNSEIEFSEMCEKYGRGFVNCRIFSLSGTHINEFENLALSLFFKQAINEKRISVDAPQAKRTYVDAKELSYVLLTLGSQGGSHNLDSGGSLITMEELAHQFAKFFDDSDLEVLSGDQAGTEYFGDYDRFNQIAKDLNIELSGIERQISNTYRAFKL